MQTSQDIEKIVEVRTELFELGFEKEKFTRRANLAIKISREAKEKFDIARSKNLHKDELERLKKAWENAVIQKEDECRKLDEVTREYEAKLRQYEELKK